MKIKKVLRTTKTEFDLVDADWKLDDLILALETIRTERGTGDVDVSIRAINVKSIEEHKDLQLDFIE